MAIVTVRALLGRFEVTIGDDSAGVTYGSAVEAARHAWELAERAGHGPPQAGPGITPEDLEQGRKSLDQNA